jgi:hypothetical protein
MRKLSLLAFIGISFFMLVSASVWEGAAELSEALPANGRYIATNSLPINTVVVATNLENGIQTILTVYQRLDTSGFLALLSKDAADALGIEKGSLTRISLYQDTDPLAYSRVLNDPRIGSEYEDFSLVPDRLRPPVGGPAPDPAQFVNSYATPPQGSQPQNGTPAIEPVRPSAATVSGFSAPIISALERGMFYVQVAAYRNRESVEYEITRRIDKNLPVAIEINPQSGEEPIYRILIGPQDFAQSLAILERYQSTYTDAIVRQGR